MAHTHRKRRHPNRATRAGAVGASLFATFAVGFAVHHTTGLPGSPAAHADAAPRAHAELAASSATRPDRLGRAAAPGRGTGQAALGTAAAARGTGAGRAHAAGTRAAHGATKASPGKLAAQATALLNAHRRTAGCAPVRSEVRLREAARRHAADMAARRALDPRSTDGEAPWERAWAQGYYFYAGHAIGAGHTEAADAVAGWLQDPRSRAVLLDCGSSEAGVAVQPGPGGPWWTVLLGYHAERR
jgi:uncharacterized protein YkwD